MGQTGSVTDLTWILIAVAAVVVIALVIGATALTSGRRRRGPSATLPPADVSPYEVDQPPAAGATATATAPPPAETEAAAPAPTLERPEPVAGRMQRLRARLAGSGRMGQTLLSILSRGDLTESDWEEIEETLLLADVGIGPTTELMDTLRTRTKVLGTTDAETVRGVLREELVKLVDPGMDRSLHLGPVVGDDGELHPATILVVGVNGTGKTTTVGKLARVLVAEDHDVVLGAADTFRAAAADQLSTWGARVGVEVVRSDREGADPAAVAFDAVKHGREIGADVVMVDTAGRLHTQDNLMAELMKIRKVISKQLPDAPHETLLTVDSTTGQNGLRQAKLFAEAVDVDGIVLTKLDGTAKGGIALAIAAELGIPVKLIGIGEQLDDLRPFDADDFARALLAP